MSIPEGFKLVPVEPTEEMQDVGASYMPVDWASPHDAAVVFKQMLAAAPTPPQPIYDEAKERELFEVYYRAEFEGNTGNELSDADIKSMRDGPWYGESRHYLNGQWAGWKACAQSRAKAGEVTP